MKAGTDKPTAHGRAFAAQVEAARQLKPVMNPGRVATMSKSARWNELGPIGEETVRRHFKGLYLHQLRRDRCAMYEHLLGLDEDALWQHAVCERTPDDALAYWTEKIDSVQREAQEAVKTAESQARRAMELFGDEYESDQTVTVRQDEAALIDFLRDVQWNSRPERAGSVPMGPRFPVLVLKFLRTLGETTLGSKASLNWRLMWILHVFSNVPERQQEGALRAFIAVLEARMDGWRAGNQAALLKMKAQREEE